MGGNNGGVWEEQYVAWSYIYVSTTESRHCGRVVKAMDLKSIGVIPRRFEPCQCR